MTGLLFDAFIYLCAAVIAVPIAKQLGLGSVLGYLIAGIVIGPTSGLVGHEAEEVRHFAEFGVVMMLFIVGLELEPRTLWNMRQRLVGLGGLQVGLTMLAVMGIGLAFQLPWQEALAVGMVLAVSSTAIVLQTLNEKGLLKSDGGQASFSVLLFQDVIIIPMLAVLPLLAAPDILTSVHGEVAHDSGAAWMDTLAGWQVALITLGAIGAVIVGGIYLTRPVFRFIARARLREVFIAAALLLVVGTALLMNLVGVSPALGTFLAGVVLANSEYRHELESDIEPFKGLLLGLFFITVGAGMDFGVLARDAVLIVGLALGLVLLKAAILYVLAVLFKIRGSDRWLFTLALAQAGEFGFVLLGFAVTTGAVANVLSQQLLMVIAVSMLMTPFLFILFDKVILPRATQKHTRDEDEIDAKGSVIIAGTGRFGQIVNRILRGNGYETVVLDLSPDTVDFIGKFGIKSFYGDASRIDLLHAAGIADAKMFIVAIDDVEKATAMVRNARQAFPNLHIIARARDRHHTYLLYNAGATDIVRETFYSAVSTGQRALRGLGHPKAEAENIARAFIRSDRRATRYLAEVFDPDIPIAENKAYIARVHEVREVEENMMRMGREGAVLDDDEVEDPFE